MSIRLFSKKRETEQFERLAGESERQVYAVCFHMMGSREDAQDCAQETMLRAYKAFGSFRRDASFSTWITRIAINVCTDALRKRRPVSSLDAMREETNFDLPDTGPTAYAQLEQKERLRIAEGLSLPLGTVKSRVNRAREKLSAILQKSSELFSSHSV